MLNEVEQTPDAANTSSEKNVAMASFVQDLYSSATHDVARTASTAASNFKLNDLVIDFGTDSTKTTARGNTDGADNWLSRLESSQSPCFPGPKDESTTGKHTAPEYNTQRENRVSPFDTPVERTLPEYPNSENRVSPNDRRTPHENTNGENVESRDGQKPEIRDTPRERSVQNPKEVRPEIRDTPREGSVQNPKEVRPEIREGRKNEQSPPSRVLTHSEKEYQKDLIPGANIQISEALNKAGKSGIQK